jgi:hypothetical protein
MRKAAKCRNGRCARCEIPRLRPTEITFGNMRDPARAVPWPIAPTITAATALRLARIAGLTICGCRISSRGSAAGPAASAAPFLLPLLVFVAARIASLHPDKLLERRCVAVQQRVYLVRRLWHAPAKSLTAGDCVRIPIACHIAARRVRLFDLLLCMSLGQRGQREERHQQHAHFALLRNRAVAGLGRAETSAPRRHTIEAANIQLSGARAKS